LLRTTKAFLKAPITTPQGGGFKSLNVTIRTTLGLYANVRPCTAYAPFVKTKHPSMDVVIIRENEEDLYTGIEYQQTEETVYAQKIITRPGSERIVRYAFEYAKAQGKKKVTCFTKDNILKLSDGLFHKIFDEIAKEYPEITPEHWIVDIGAAKLADTPEAFELIVLPNLYGDILSDVAAQIAGSVGLAGSANIGINGAMFEAIHGSAPRRAGQDLANPSGLLLASVMMLSHLGLGEVASLVHNAWLKTIEDGVHTYDIHGAESKKKVGTKEFALNVVQRLGDMPSKLKAASYSSKAVHLPLTIPSSHAAKTLVGADLYFESKDRVENLQKKFSTLCPPSFNLDMISNRGVKVWPDAAPETALGDVWRCRFIGNGISAKEIIDLLTACTKAGETCLKMETLFNFDGKPGYSDPTAS
jgi:isocitrate dehydrogenase